MNVLHIGRNITRVFHSPQEIKGYIFSDEYEKDLEKSKVFDNIANQKTQPVVPKVVAKQVAKEPEVEVKVETNLSSITTQKITKLF